MVLNEDKSEESLDVEDLKKYMALSVEDKLTNLQEINSFLMETMSSASKKAWEELKKSG